MGDFTRKKSMSVNVSIKLKLESLVPIQILIISLLRNGRRVALRTNDVTNL